MRGPYRAVAAWALGSSLLFYGFVLFSKTDRGWTFGNRHLIAIIPLTTFFSGQVFQEKKNKIFLFGMLWISLSMMLPGLSEPWKTPNSFFIFTNMGINLILLMGYGASYLYRPCQKWIQEIQIISFRKKIIFGSLMALFMAGEWALYFETL